MANLTKEKRERMISFIERLKQSNNNDDSIIALNEIENHITEKKFGLVFEEHTENIDDILVDNIPVFNELPDKKMCFDKELPYNFLIEGDNLHALYLLEKTHKGKLDCIYIDPPYNTGAKNWKYNNDYVDSHDVYRHSKWLSMMDKRLRIAKVLLKDDGVLICAIDENELATLKLLIEDIFDIAYQVDVITIIQNPRGIQGDNFSYTNEYALFVYRKHYKVIGNREIEDEDIDWRGLRDNGGESLRTDARNCFYPIIVKNDQIIGFGDVILDMDIHPKQVEYNEEEDSYYVYPVDVQGIERKWRYARQSVENIIDNLRAKKIGKDRYEIELGKNYGTYRTVWTDKKYDANEHGTQLINSMVPGNDFDFPKSLWNVYECLYAVTKNREDAIILDFFAGSGTTGHAVEMLNKLCGGNRKYILVTNNDVGEKKEKEFKQTIGEPEEHPEEFEKFKEKYGICSSITYPRMVATAKGYTHVKDVKEVLYEKKFNNTYFNNIVEEISKIKKITDENESKYDEIKNIYENNFIKVCGINKKGEEIEGIPHNLKYFKCSVTPRKPEDYLLSNALLLHIKEMIEIENAIEIDGVNNVIILNKEDYNKYILDNDNFANIKKIWLNQNIIFDNEELAKMKEKDFRYIPREYFGQELKEVAE